MFSKSERRVDNAIAELSAGDLETACAELSALLPSLEAKGFGVSVIADALMATGISVGVNLLGAEKTAAILYVMSLKLHPAGAQAREQRH